MRRSWGISTAATGSVEMKKGSFGLDEAGPLGRSGSSTDNLPSLLVDATSSAEVTKASSQTLGATSSSQLTEEGGPSSSGELPLRSRKPKGDLLQKTEREDQYIQALEKAVAAGTAPEQVELPKGWGLTELDSAVIARLRKFLGAGTGCASEMTLCIRQDSVVHPT